MRAAIAARDFARVGELAEYSCLKLHALMITTRPALIYWNAATVAAIHTVTAAARERHPGLLHDRRRPAGEGAVRTGGCARGGSALAAVPGVQETRTSGLGGGAHLVSRP